jgi:hypothetical protein
MTQRGPFKHKFWIIFYTSLDQTRDIHGKIYYSAKSGIITLRQTKEGVWSQWNEREDKYSQNEINEREHMIRVKRMKMQIMKMK